MTGIVLKTRHPVSLLLAFLIVDHKPYIGFGGIGVLLHECYTCDVSAWIQDWMEIQVKTKGIQEKMYQKSSGIVDLPSALELLGFASDSPVLATRKYSMRNTYAVAVKLIVPAITTRGRGRIGTKLQCSTQRLLCRCL